MKNLKKTAEMRCKYTGIKVLRDFKKTVPKTLVVIFLFLSTLLDAEFLHLTLKQLQTILYVAIYLQ